MLFAFEAAEREPDPSRRRGWLTFVVVGAGPTGVELVGRPVRDRPARPGARLPPHRPDAGARHPAGGRGPRPARLRAGAVGEGAASSSPRLGRRRPHGRDGDGDRRPRASASAPSGSRRGRSSGRRGWRRRPWRGRSGVPLDRAGRVLVEPDLTIPGHPEVYVVGDLASLMQDGKPVPGVAPAAMQEAQHAARNIRPHAPGRAAPAVPLPRQGLARHDRPRGRRRRPRPDQALGRRRLARLAVHPHPLPDRVPQPVRRPVRVGLVVRHLRPRGPADHRPPAPARPERARSG